MRKIFLIATILLIFAIYLTGCTKSSNNGQTVLEVTNLKSSDITKIIFYDGRGGLNKPLTVENKQQIDEFMGYLDKCIIKKAAHITDETGWIHEAVFYNNDKRIVDITFVNPMIINNTEYYDVLEGNLSTDKIDDFLKSVDPSWKTP